MATLGEILREQRTKLGLSLEQAEEATRIRARLLDMLENDDYDHLPNPGYVKGYVASYAKFLELDPLDMTDRYRRQIGDLHEHEINVAAEPVDLPTTREQHAIPWKTAVIVVAVIAVAALAVWGVVSLIRPSEPDIPVLPPKESVEPTKPTGSAEATSGKKTTKKKPAASTFALTVAVREGQRSWLRITVDEKVVYEGVLDGGNKKDYKVKKEAVVRIGAPGGVDITRNGEPVEIPSGDIPTVTIKQ
ncbi:MAG: helix-turn-helix domain-containing protein [Coriobacteriales bacterium]|nr:helix-turn-helix domain-containing protein [Coriobacteriales bacterium]